MPASPATISSQKLTAQSATAMLARSTTSDLEKLLIQSEAQECRGSLKRFVRLAWPTIYPNRPYVGGWHIDAICDHLQALTERKIRCLGINVPRRHSKSSIVSVKWPAWVWTRRPEEQFMFASYAHAISVRDSVRCRRVIEHQWYKERFTNFHLTSDQNTKIRFDNNVAGYRFATSVGGTVLGDGGDVLVADDPNNLKKIHSPKDRFNVVSWYREVFSGGLNDPMTGIQLLIQQRGHEGDLTGYLKSVEKDRWEWLVLPAEYSPKYHTFTKIWQDPRKVEGELLWEKRFNRAYVDHQRKTLGTYGAAAQLDQRPVPAAGGVFHLDWFRYYPPGFIPPKEEISDSCISIDMSFGSTKDDASYTVAQAWVRTINKNYFLLDQIRGQWEYPEAKRRIKAFMEKWSWIYAVVVENKANGPALLQDLGLSCEGLIPAEPRGTKEARARSVSPFVEAGHVFIPDPDHPECPKWIAEFLPEIQAFPKCPTDDQVDALSQALDRLRQDMAFGVTVGEDEGYDGVPAQEEDRFATQASQRMRFYRPNRGDN